MKLDKYKEAGRMWANAIQQKRVMERHDREHPYEPELYQGECVICAERVDQTERERLAK